MSDFVVGKSYQMRGGGIAGPLRKNTNTDSKRFPLAHLGRSWTLDGYYDMLGDTPFVSALDLLAGAIDEEDAARIDFTKRMMSGLDVDVPALLRRVAELEAVLQDLLNLQYAKDQLRALDCGIGTATENAVWLCARAALPTTDRGGS